MELQTEKKVKRARDTLTRTLSRTIFMFNLFVKWEYTSANNNQQSHIWNRHRATTIITQQEPATEQAERWFERWLELRRELGLHVCWKMIDYFLAYKSKWFTLFCANFFFGELCWKQNNVHSIEIVDFFLFVFM